MGPDPGISISEISSATPLMSLSAIVLDTETTGLDTKIARVIQIGAVRISKGVLQDHDAFDQLVNPGIPIPPETTRIHGLSDADVAGAGSFNDVRPDLERWMGRSIMLGFSIGFDLAVLSKEYERAGVHWRAPRSLDVRHLAKLVAPELPDLSLDTIAGWLGIEVTDRHQALGDARMTARVYLALVERLRVHNIRTLAEAEQACRSLSQDVISEAEAGWHDAVRSVAVAKDQMTALAQIDAYPYSHRVSDVMSTPPLFAEPSASVRSVLAMLIEQQISSVFVKPDRRYDAYGIITERDILRSVNTDPERALAASAAELAKRPLDTVAADAFLYRAVGRMSRLGYRHLGVHDDHGDVVGALSSRDLLRQRAQDAISLADAIDHAHSAEELGTVWASLALVAQGLVSEDVDARDVAAVISRELCALTRRACQIAERDMQAEGRGGPPVAYAMLVLGSGGRGESLLAMDQDNAIVYAEGEAGSEADLWLEELGGRVADILHQAGVPYCKGGIMGKNREWRKSVADWKRDIRTWITRHKPEDILNTDIFFDAVAVHGDRHLANEILDKAYEIGGQSSDFLNLMARNAADVNTPIGWFGRFQLKEGRIDLKMAGIMPIFSSARVAAIEHGIRERSTPRRLSGLKSRSELPAAFIDNLIEAHQILFSEILFQQLRDIDEGIPASNNVAPDKLTKAHRDRLRWAVETAGTVSDLFGIPAKL